MKTWIECPVCGEGQLKVGFVVGNRRAGDRTSPPEPAETEIVSVHEQYGCECEVGWDELTRAEREQEDRLFEEALDRARRHGR